MLGSEKGSTIRSCRAEKTSLALPSSHDEGRKLVTQVHELALSALLVEEPQ